MGNMVSSKSSVGTGGKIIFSDGTTQSLSEPTIVAELMLDHPNHYVIDSHLVPTTGTKVTPLPADHVLDTCKVYLLLPMTRGKLAEEARRVLASARSSKRLRRSWSAPMPPIRDEMERRSMDLTIAGVLDQAPEFLTISRQLSCKGWKPSLGTIVETGLVKKVPHWLF